MKNLFIILIFIACTKLNAQHSCCAQSTSTSASLAFNQMANNSLFISAHSAPEPLDYQPSVGKMVSLKCADGKEAKVFEVKSGTAGMGKVILMFHEWWGLNDYIKREAERLHSETGFTVVAMDLYDGKIATNPDSAGKLMQGLKEQRARVIISAGIEYAGKFGKIQTIGWCMGGGWSFQAALMAGPKCVGAVMYYGMPETDTTKLSELNAPVLGIFAAKDQWVSPKIVAAFSANMKALNKVLEVKNYNADHAFANPSNPKFNEEFSEDAHQLALTFFKKNFPELKVKQPESEK